MLRKFLILTRMFLIFFCVFPAAASRIASGIDIPAAAGAPAAAADGTGRVLCAYWRQLPGKTVADLTRHPAFPDIPGEQVYLDRLEIPEDQENDFGTLIRGYVHPLANGAYVFSISSDDQSELWLSLSEYPAAKTKVAEVATWTLSGKFDQFPSQQSKPITLQAGKKYYIEILHKDGGGDNHLAVAWKLPDGTQEVPIPGKRLSPAALAAIPPPQVYFDPEKMPAEAGQHRLKAQVKYMAQQVAVPVLLTIPRDSTCERANAVLVFLPDAAQQPPGADGYCVQGPDEVWQKKESFRIWSRFIGITLQCPAGQDWNKHIAIQAIAAVLEKLLANLPVDRNRVYLTGWSSGGTAVWRLALEKPELFAAVAPVCGMKEDDKTLPQRLHTMPVYIVTGVKNGFATGCANTMRDLLAANVPQPQIYYEMEMGTEVAQKVYNLPWLYNWMLQQHRGSIPPALPSRAPVPLVSTLQAAGALNMYYVRRTLVLSMIFLFLSFYFLRRPRPPAR